ncbi:MAG: hypothetical protein R6U26_01860 [Candidatus Undinarchaeales archaeon]
MADERRKRKKEKEPKSAFGPEIPEPGSEQKQNAPPRAVKRAPMDEPIKKRKMSPEDVKEEVGFPPAYEKNLPPEPQQGEYNPRDEAAPEPVGQEPTGEVPPGYEPYQEEGPKPPSELRPAEEPFTPERKPQTAQRRQTQEPRRQPPAPPERPPRRKEMSELKTGREPEPLGLEEKSPAGSTDLSEIKNIIEQISEDVSEIKEKQTDLEDTISNISIDEESIEEIKTTVEKIDAIVSDGIPALIKVIQGLKKSSKTK